MPKLTLETEAEFIRVMRGLGCRFETMTTWNTAFNYFYLPNGGLMCSWHGINDYQPGFGRRVVLNAKELIRSARMAKR